MPTLLCMFVTLFGCVSTQVYGQQSLFDRLTNDRFIFGLQNGEEYDIDEYSNEDSDEDSGTETDEYNFDKASETGSETGGGQQTGESTEQQTDKALTQQTDESVKQQIDKADSSSDIQQNDKADAKHTAPERDYFSDMYTVFIKAPGFLPESAVAVTSVICSLNRRCPYPTLNFR